jgi:hypothetical protein
MIYSWVMGRPKNPTELGDIIEKGIKDQLRAASTWAERQESLVTAIKFMAVKAKIQMPDEGSGFDEPDDKGE